MEDFFEYGVIGFLMILVASLILFGIIKFSDFLFSPRVFCGVYLSEHSIYIDYRNDIDYKIYSSDDNFELLLMWATLSDMTKDLIDQDYCNNKLSKIPGKSIYDKIMEIKNICLERNSNIRSKVNKEQLLKILEQRIKKKNSRKSSERSLE